MWRISVKSDKIWQEVYQNSPIGISIISLAGSFVNPNPTLCKILGRDKEELEACTWQQLTHPEDLFADKELAGDVLLGNRDSYQIRKRYYRKDGSICHAILSVGCDRDEYGAVKYFISQIVDNSEDEERKREERERLEDYQVFKDSVLNAIAENQFILHYQEIF